MKLYILFFLVFFIPASLNAASNIVNSETLQDIKREIFGSSLASVDDARVLALIGLDILTTSMGALIIGSLFSDKKEVKELHFLQKAFSYIGGNVFIVAGIIEIILARALITALDEVTHECLKELHYKK